jgi:hypothetical protein
MKYTKSQIVETFTEGIDKISKFISWLDDFKRRCEWISNQTMDNADPECEAATCVERLGVLLATLNIYQNEYQQELTEETK